MKKEWIRNFIALLMLGGLIVYVSWNRKTTIEENDKAEKAKKFVQFDISTIERIELKNKEGEMVLEKRTRDDKGKYNDAWASLSQEQDDPTEWMMTEPLKSLAERNLISTLLDNIKDLTATKVIDEKGENPEAYNLKEPLLEIKLFQKNQTSPKMNVKIGDENSSNTGLYAQDSSNPKIVLVGTALNYARSRKANEWRSKEVLGFKDVNKMKTVDVQYHEKGRFSLSKNEKGWTVKTPMPYPADERAVESFLMEIKGLRADDIVNEDATKEAKKFGFDQPYAKITYTFDTESGIATRTMLIGNNFEGDKTMYVRRIDFPEVFKVASHNKTTLTKQAKDFADKKPFTLEENKVDRVSVMYNGKTTDLTLRDGEWIIAKPVADQADSSEVRSIISKLLSMRGEEFYSDWKDYPKGRPTTVFTLYEGTKTQGLSMYDLKDLPLKGIRSTPQMAYRFERADYDQVISKLDSIREKNLMPFQQQDLNSFQIKKGNLSVNFGREANGDWKLSAFVGNQAEVKTKLGKKENIEELVREIEGLKISGFLDQEKLSDSFAEEFRVELHPKKGKSFTWSVGPNQDGRRKIQSKERGVVADTEAKDFENLEKLISTSSNKG